jgi:hypothetical protein
MGWGALFRRRPNTLRGRPEDLRRQLIARHCLRRSLLDVGCMWNVSGAYAFPAHDSGASAVTGMDLMRATAEFDAKNAARGNAVRFVQGDINSPAVLERPG